MIPQNFDEVTERISVSFSADGERAACLASDGPELYQAEVWSFTRTGVRTRRLPTADGETLFTQVVPVSDDHVLMARHTGDRAELCALRAVGAGAQHRPLANVGPAGLRLLSCPGQTVLAVTTRADGQVTVFEVDADASGLRPVATGEGPLVGGAALDPTGRWIGFTRHTDRGPRIVRLDRARHEIVEVPVAGDRRTYLLLADPASGRALVAADGADGLRPGYVRGLGSSAPVYSTALDELAQTARPAAISPGGDRTAFVVHRGARSHLYVHHAATDRLTEVAMPAGVLTGAAAWSAGGLRLGYQSAICPSGVLAVSPDGSVTTLSPTPEPTWSPAHLETFGVGSGEVEAVVYGDWRTADRLVVALHGGPAAAWELEFEPLFQHLTAAGIAVVAPNQRGSTGYGSAHADAIRGAWGGPDGDDIADLGATLIEGRRAGARKPMLVGQSYGGYLTLQIALGAAHLWSRAAVLAGFLSPETLWADAGAQTRSLIERLGGRTPRGGGLDPWSEPVATPLLVLHGTADERIPIRHARRLHHRLHELGAAEGIPVEYREIPGAGHDPLSGSEGDDALRRLIAFLRD